MTTAIRPEQAATTAVATKQDEPKGDIRTLLQHDKARERIAPFLPHGVDFDRVVASVHYAARQTPGIVECTPASIIDAVARTQQWGLDIGITAHLVPFNTNIGTRTHPKWAKICTPIADYKGLAHLMVRSGAVRHVETRVVYEKDRFSYSYGTDAKIEHQPVAAKERGAMTHAYVVLRLPFGHTSFTVMAVEDIEEIRQNNSKQWKNGPLKPWYAMKTVVRQAAKLVPNDPRFSVAARVVEEDEDAEFGRVLEPQATRKGLAAGDEEQETPATTARSIHNTGVARLAEPQYASEDVPFEDADDMDETWIQDADEGLPLNDRRAKKPNALEHG